MAKDLAAGITYRRDKIRAPFMGILEAGWQAFPLLIAIRYYNAPESIKAFIAGAGPIGFLLTPLTLYIISRIGIAPAKACALMFVCTALLIAGASIGQSLITFTICIIGSQMASVQHGPLMLQVYANNYSENERGQRVTTPLVLIACSTISLLGLEVNTLIKIFIIFVMSSL